jgi:FAD/FMN-containing dehydrogenase
MDYIISSSCTQMASLGSHFSETCEVISPEPDADIHEVISRWSDAGVCLPALIVTPSTREDICEAIKYATAKHLTLVPGAGGHGVAVPIDDRTLYLNLRRFNHVAVDVKNGLVTFGGGATNEEVLGACINAGYYTG